MLNSERSIVGLELIVARKGEAVYSRFGHALLRFVGAGNDLSNDYIVSLAALVDDPSISYKKGILGGYSLFPVIKIPSEFWQNYVIGENRSLLRFAIPSNPVLRRNLLSKIEQMIKDPKKFASYKFVTNNCANALARLLEEAGFPHQPALLDPVIPVNLGDWAAWSVISPYAPVEVHGLMDLISRMASELRLEMIDFRDARKWPADAAEILERNFSDFEIKRLFLVGIPLEVRRALLRNHNYRGQGPSFPQVIEFAPLPAPFYELCSTLECARNVLSLEEKIWKKSEYHEARRLRDFIYWRYLVDDRTEGSPITSHFSEDLSVAPLALRSNPAFLSHLQLLLRAQHM